MSDMVKRLLEKGINITYDSRATTFFERQGIKINRKNNRKASALKIAYP